MEAFFERGTPTAPNKIKGDEKTNETKQNKKKKKKKSNHHNQNH